MKWLCVFLIGCGYEPSVRHAQRMDTALYQPFLDEAVAYFTSKGVPEDRLRETVVYERPQKEAEEMCGAPSGCCSVMTRILAGSEVALCPCVLREMDHVSSWIQFHDEDYGYTRWPEWVSSIEERCE